MQFLFSVKMILWPLNLYGNTFRAAKDAFIAEKIALKNFLSADVKHVEHAPKKNKWKAV